jgi:hypothetical protein
MLNAWDLHHFQLGKAPHPRFAAFSNAISGDASDAASKSSSVIIWPPPV